MVKHVFAGAMIDDDHPLPVAPPSAAAIVAHRVGLQGVDFPTHIAHEPEVVVLNPNGHKNALAHIVGASWATTDTDVELGLTPWRRSAGGIWVRGRETLITAKAKETATFTQLGALNYTADSLVDAGQATFASVKPDSDDPSSFIVAAEPGDFSSAALFAWVAPGGVASAVQVQRGHLSASPAGWIGGGTPDGGDHAAYSIRRPNISSTLNYSQLGGADFALTLSSVSGVNDGSFFVDILVVLFS